MSGPCERIDGRAHARWRMRPMLARPTRPTLAP